MQNDYQLLSTDAIPPLLREIPQPPKQLYVRGTLPSMEYKWLAVVGSRTITPYGKQACEHLIEGLRGQPIVIVSGLALGIDAYAHECAMKAGLPTVAIPGSGLAWEVMYPRANVRLAHAIIEAGGAHLSEFDPDTKAAEWTFPQRNRIMAGISHATLVIEAREKSGSLITAKFAADYNRDLLVVPGSIFAAQSAGGHQFLKLGATPITTSEDVLQAFGLTAHAVRTIAHADLTADELRVIKHIASPLTRDELIRALNMPTSEANVLISMMELKGLIAEEFGVIRVR